MSEASRQREKERHARKETVVPEDDDMPLYKRRAELKFWNVEDTEIAKPSPNKVEIQAQELVDEIVKQSSIVSTDKFAAPIQE